jgi:hypothetical protein
MVHTYIIYQKEHKQYDPVQDSYVNVIPVRSCETNQLLKPGQATGLPSGRQRLLLKRQSAGVFMMPHHTSVDNTIGW